MLRTAASRPHVHVRLPSAAIQGRPLGRLISPGPAIDAPLPQLERCWFLTGPTAGGKTAVGLELAERLDAEILSLDSMAVYRGLDIGTAKPTAEERRRVPHHLLDLVEPEEEFSLARYVEAARAAAADVLARGRTPLFVGGTPLYLKALLRGMFAGPPADWEFRRGLLRVAEAQGPEALHARLAAVDPASATRLPPGDTRRIVRALEVYEKTGRPIGEWQRQFDRARPAEELRVFALSWPRDELNRRIDGRVAAMFAAGLVREVQDLLAAGRSFGRSAGQALGYREVLEHLRGAPGLPETIHLVATRSRQFAKRQRTWFRSLAECRTAEVDAGDSPAAVADRIAAARVERRHDGE